MQTETLQPVVRVALPVPLRQLFDYLPAARSTPLRPGMRVLVPFGHRKLIGVIVKLASGSDLPLSKLATVLDYPDGDQCVLGSDLLALLMWCSQYYKHAPGEVVFSALPPLLRRLDGKIPDHPRCYTLTDAGRQRLRQSPGRIPAQFRLLEAMADDTSTQAELRMVAPGWRKLLSRLLDQGWVEAVPATPAALQPTPGPELGDEQRAAVESISTSLGGFRCHLLDGVTGSGKTEVYLQLLERVLRTGGQGLLLVPEIGLTPQLVGRFRERLGFEPAVTHSGLSERQRLRTWAAARGGLARLVIGTRSALFLPMPELKLLILDEEHDLSFKQQDGFRYSSRDLAVKRASEIGVTVVLGTATPSLESFNNADSGRYDWHRLRRRATGAAEPCWRVLDLRQQTLDGGISTQAMDAIGDTLERGQQALIFLNRRGYAPVILCHQCGWHASCPRCDANLTWHRAGKRLLCHHCDSGTVVPDLCPECGADALQGAGEGTEQLEQVLGVRFPATSLLRFDRDTVRRRGEFERLAAQVKTGEPCLLIGTQMLAKGHHFPRVTLVVIVNLDQALYSADFRALERMGQLMVQVAGRAGRDDLPGEVILQTHYPQHPSLHTLLTAGYEAFAGELSAMRRSAGLPPFSHQALLRGEANKKEHVSAFLGWAKRQFPPGEAQVYGPFPAMMELRGGRIRWYLLVEAGNRPALHRQLDQWVASINDASLARRVRWSLDVDPQDF